MTLFNTDKGSQDRLNPSPDGHDIHLARMAHSTTSIAPRAVGTQTGARISTKNDVIAVFDDSNERINIGRLPDGTFGIAISKEGYDVSGAFS
jgi:hypothetical protein